MEKKKGNRGTGGSARGGSVSRPAKTDEFVV
jgi:hypothetical protein